MNHDDEFDPAEAMSEVIDAAQMYLAECDPANLAIVNERCMPYPIISAEDVELYAHKLRKECIARRNAASASPPRRSTVSRSVSSSSSRCL